MNTLINKLQSVGRKMAPTLKHRPVLTYGILGTVYGISPEGEVKYFDYDWDGALEFAGITLENVESLDARYAKSPRAFSLPGADMWHPERTIRKGERAWWVLK
jgi:hypothetical protein